MSDKRAHTLHLIRGLAGAIAGAAAGYFLFQWLLSQGYYAGLVPGAAVGIGCGLASRTKSRLLAVVCGLAGGLWGVFTEWKLFPFEDRSFGFFVQNLKGLHWAMLAGGALLAAYFGLGRSR